MITALLVLARTLHIGSALLMVSLLFFRQVILRSEGAPDFGTETNVLFSYWIRRWLFGAFLIHILSGVVWFWIVAADVSDSSLWDILDFGLLKIVFEQTQFGQLWLVRLVLCLALGVMLLIAGRRQALILSGLLLVSLAWAGHAASGVNHRVWHLGTDFGHLAIASVWPVGLLPLALYLHTAVKTGSSSQLAGAVATLRCFSRISLIAVGLLFLTGFVNAWFLIPSISALFTSTYGQLLLGKIALFLAMIALGARNRFRLLPQLDQKEPAPSDFARLRRAVLVENILALFVLLIVGAMGASPPPQSPG
jgi:putative copper resistance protein D